MNSYPLSWPDGWRRTDPLRRETARFNRQERKYWTPSVPGQQGHSYLTTKKLSVSDAVARLTAELDRMGVKRDDLIISTNLQVRLDGLPRSNQAEPKDPGAAVYWKRAGEEARCMAIDRYTCVADNIAALAATLDAMRAIERHGGAEILTRAFRGFAALPEQTSSTWRHIFGFDERAALTPDDIDAKFAELVHVHHPDKGGDPEKFQEILRARDSARRELFGLASRRPGQ